MASKDIDLNIKAHDKTGAAFKAAQSNLQNLASSTAILDGPLSAVSGRISAVAAALGRTSPVMIAFGVAIAGSVYVMKEALGAAIEYEKQMFRLEGALKANGYAAGFTAKELNELAEDLDRTTLANVSEVREGIAQMLIFKSVAGDTLKQSIVLAQDWAAISGKSFGQTSRDIARALDSYEGLTTVERRLNALTPAQEEMAKAAFDAGNMIKYQSIVLQGLHDKLDGVGAKEAEGLAGKIDGLAFSWKTLLEELGTGAPASLAGSVISELTEYANGLKGVASNISDFFDPERDTAKLRRMADIAFEISDIETARDFQPNMETVGRVMALRKELEAISETFAAEKQRAIALAEDAKKKDKIEADQEQAIKARSQALKDQEKLVISLRTEEEKLYDQYLDDAAIIGNAIASQQALDGNYSASAEQLAALTAVTERYNSALQSIADKKQKPIDAEESRKQKGLEKLQESLLGEEELRQNSFLKKLDLIDEFAASEDQAEQMRLQAARKYADEEVRIAEDKNIRKIASEWKMAEQTASIGTNLASIFADQSRSAFKTYQGFMIAESTINTLAAFTAELRNPLTFGPQKILSAGAILAAGMAKVHKIGQMSPSGGGTGGGGGALSSSGVPSSAYLPASQRQPSGDRTTVEIHVEGVKKPITLDVAGIVEAINGDQLTLTDGVTQNRIIAAHG